jgi:hypothetical protein
MAEPVMQGAHCGGLCNPRRHTLVCVGENLHPSTGPNSGQTTTTKEIHS